MWLCFMFLDGGVHNLAARNTNRFCKKKKEKKSAVCSHLPIVPTTTADGEALCVVRWRPIKVQLRECHNYAVVLLYEILNWWQMQAVSFPVMGEGLVKGKYPCFTLLLMLSILFAALYLLASAAALELESSCTCSTPQIFAFAY